MGRTIVLITHEHDVAARAGRQLVVRDGEIVTDDGERRMNWPETFRTGAEAVQAHRLRSMLTMLGIIIGVSSVILTVGLGQGAQDEVKSQIDSLGSNLLVVSPGSTTSTTGVRGGFGSASTLTLADARRSTTLGRPGRRAGRAGRRSSSVSLVNGTTNWTTTLVGTTADWLDVRVADAVERAGSSPPPRSSRARRSWCSAPTPRASCSPAARSGRPSRSTARR